MKLKDAFRAHRPPDLGVRLPWEGRAAPSVQYAVACFLADRPAPRRELALRALRPSTELGPDPWTALDPSLKQLRADDSPTRATFFRMIGGADPVVERASLKVKRRNIALGKPVRVTAKVTALPLTEAPSRAAALQVEFGFGKEYTDYKGWTTWAPMILTGGNGKQLRYGGTWKPASAGGWWVVARCRTGKGSWAYVGGRGYDVSNPLKVAQTAPAVVQVIGTPAKPEPSAAESIAASIERLADALECICDKPTADGKDSAGKPST